MRLAFWRAGKDRAVVQRAVSKPAPVAYKPAAVSDSGDLDLRAIGEALGTTEDTVKTSLFRATRKLRAQLEGIR